MKIITYNINGIRAAITKGLLDWMKATNADVYCFQEIKATPDQLDITQFHSIGYEHCYWFPAQKKGYSGVAIISKIAANNIEYGCGIEKYDSEGRAIVADFNSFSLINVYMPSGSSGEDRQAFKYEWLDDFFPYASTKLKEKKNIVICGDFNICHKAIDIHNPKSNANTSGFLPEERNWMEHFFNNGFTDAFRYFNEEPHQYTWWSYRANARNKNLGWRIDYHAVNDAFAKQLKRCVILPEAKHSDHCPVLLEINA
jgi:exodeoxyribonuclease-3